jgi:hypothetical protein
MKKIFVMKQLVRSSCSIILVCVNALDVHNIERKSSYSIWMCFGAR